MAYSTSVIAVDPATGQVQIYAPPNVKRQGTGNYNVTYGQVLDVPDGTTIPAGATWTVISGTVLTSGTAQIQQVTVTPAV